MQTRPKKLLLVQVLLALSGCATRPDAHDPPFANKPYEPFSRTAAVNIALDQWHYWGNRIVDTPPSAYHPTDAQAKQERDNGDWQQVGLYWWLGMNAGHFYDDWTGKHDAAGNKFPPGDDARFAWSAAFISYVMRIAGAGPNFPYSPNHAKYIDYAWQAAHGKIRNPLLLAENPTIYAPVPGDLICAGRDSASTMRYADLPTHGFFPAHCAIVVKQRPGVLSVIGGNVDDTVALTHVPTTGRDTLQHRNGTIVDPRYDWFVALRVLYQRN